MHQRKQTEYQGVFDEALAMLLKAEEQVAQLKAGWLELQRIRTEQWSSHNAAAVQRDEEVARRLLSLSQTAARARPGTTVTTTDNPMTSVPLSIEEEAHQLAMAQLAVTAGVIDPKSLPDLNACSCVAH